MTSAEPALDTRIDRAPGRVMRTASVLVPGVRRVRDQVEPYAAAWIERSRRSLEQSGRRWIVLGDSMSQAVGASAYDAGWVDQLAARLHRDGHDLAIVNLSATGARTTDLLERQLPVLDSLPPQDPAAPPALVTVLVGSNDLFGGRGPRGVLPAAMEELVSRLPAGAVVATLPQPARAATLANRHVERAAEQGRVHLVDMRAAGPASWRGRLAEDRFHPNDAGYAAIADALEPTVRRVLGGSDWHRLVTNGNESTVMVAVGDQTVPSRAAARWRRP